MSVELPPSELPPVPVGAPVALVRSGFGHNCVVVPGGRVRCWGGGESGQLGYGSSASVGAEGTPAEAGDVPMTQRSDPRWTFVNPFALRVWLRQHDEGERGVQLGLFVENTGVEAVRDFRAWLAFSRAELPSATPKLWDQRTPWSRAALEVAGSTFNVVLDFEGRSLLPGRSSSGGSRSREQLRAAFLPRERAAQAFQLWNDYSASEQKRSRASWRVTRRVQLVDSEGIVTYGYAIR